MAKLEKLTPEQNKLMTIVRDEWIDLALNQNKKGIDKKIFEDGIRFLYKDLLKKPMPKVIYCDSWLSCLLTIEILKKLSSKDSHNFLGDSVRASVRASVWDSVRDSVRASVGASVRDSVRDSVRASVGASVRDSVRDSVGASVGASVRDSVWGKFRKLFKLYRN